MHTWCTDEPTPHPSGQLSSTTSNYYLNLLTTFPPLSLSLSLIFSLPLSRPLLICIMASVSFDTNTQYTVNLGASFSSASNSNSKAPSKSSSKNSDIPGYCLFKYNFKPESIDYSQYGSISKDPKGEVTVAYASTIEDKPIHVFKGPEKPYRGVDCALVYDEETKTFTLECLGSLISLTQNRISDPQEAKRTLLPGSNKVPSKSAVSTRSPPNSSTSVKPSIKETERLSKKKTASSAQPAPSKVVPSRIVVEEITVDTDESSDEEDFQDIINDIEKGTSTGGSSRESSRRSSESSNHPSPKSVPESRSSTTTISPVSLSKPSPVTTNFNANPSSPQISLPTAIAYPSSQSPPIVHSRPTPTSISSLSSPDDSSSDDEGDSDSDESDSDEEFADLESEIESILSGSERGSGSASESEGETTKHKTAESSPRNVADQSGNGTESRRSSSEKYPRHELVGLAEKGRKRTSDEFEIEDTEGAATDGGTHANKKLHVDVDASQVVEKKRPISLSALSHDTGESDSDSDSDPEPF